MVAVTAFLAIHALCTNQQQRAIAIASLRQSAKLVVIAEPLQNTTTMIDHLIPAGGIVVSTAAIDQVYALDLILIQITIVILQTGCDRHMTKLGLLWIGQDRVVYG